MPACMLINAHNPIALTLAFASILHSEVLVFCVEMIFP